jgi:hypothetical protein
MVLLSIAFLVCTQATAADAVGLIEAAAKPPQSGDRLSTKVATKTQNGRKGFQKKSASKSPASSRTSKSGNKRRQSVAKKQPAVVAKSSIGRRSTPTVLDSSSEAQLRRAEACKKRIDTESQPARILLMAEECERDISDDTLASEIRQIGNGARQATEVQRSAGLSVDFFTHPEGDPELHGLVHRAARGDRQAAYRIADAYKTGQMGVHANARRMEQWLRFSAELGDGRASWELAEHYNYGGLVADAAKYEKKAEELGYRPGVRLPSRGY